MSGRTTSFDSYVPSHIQQWAEDLLLHQASAQSQEDASRSVIASGKYNAIEEEVIVGGRRSTECSDDDINEEHRQPTFARHMFMSKNAHRVACLLASARLIQTVCAEG